MGPSFRNDWKKLTGEDPDLVFVEEQARSFGKFRGSKKLLSFSTKWAGGPEPVAPRRTLEKSCSGSISPIARCDAQHVNDSSSRKSYPRSK
jgi:hypothetical protein